MPNQWLMSLWLSPFLSMKWAARPQAPCHAFSRITRPSCVLCHTPGPGQAASSPSSWWAPGPLLRDTAGLCFCLLGCAPSEPMPSVALPSAWYSPEVWYDGPISSPGPRCGGCLETLQFLTELSSFGVPYQVTASPIPVPASSLTSALDLCHPLSPAPELANKLPRVLITPCPLSSLALWASEGGRRRQRAKAGTAKGRAEERSTGRPGPEVRDPKS